MQSKISSFQQHIWHKHFKKYRFKTRFLQISHQLLQYILQDSFIINQKYQNQTKTQSDNNVPSFPDLENFIEKCKEQFGQFFIKLNSKAPKDCINWLPQLKSRTIKDVIMILKCSDLLIQNMNQNEQKKIEENQQTGIYLIIRDFWKIDKKNQFRCFILKNKLVGISQRYTENIFNNIILNKQKIKSRISDFLIYTIMPKINIQNYVIDLYLTQDKIYIIDIDSQNAWKILFENKDFEQQQELQIRCVQQNSEIVYEDLSRYKVPAQMRQYQNLNQIIEMLSNENQKQEIYQ